MSVSVHSSVPRIGTDINRTDPNLPAGLRRAVTRILRTGVTVAGVLLLVGLVLLAWQGSVGSWPGGFGGPGYVAAVLRGVPLAYFLTGTLVLVATPVLRVAVSAALFAKDHDFPFVAITLLVLGLIVLTAAIGVAP